MEALPLTHPSRVFRISFMIPQYSRVRLTTDKYEVEGGRIGMIGYVIESYADGKYEVEFSNADGITLAQFVVGEDDLILAPETKPKI
jgi:hypothetical protein